MPKIYALSDGTRGTRDQLAKMAGVPVETIGTRLKRSRNVDWVLAPRRAHARKTGWHKCHLKLPGSTPRKKEEV